MKVFLSLYLLLSLTARAAVWTLPSANQGQWTPGTNVGVQGGIDQYLAGGASDRAVTGTVINITSAPYSADNTGATDVKSAVDAAIAAASAGDVIYFPAGTYLFDSGFIFSGYKDNITIRGAGTASTTLNCSVAGQPIFAFNAPGSMDSNEQTVTGTKTKGTATLAIADTTNYTVGRLVMVSVENETNTTRIQAGATPVWHSIGAPFKRAYTHKITAVTANTSITIDPPIPDDWTSLTVKTGLYPSDNRTDGWGFEDFSVSFDEAEHPTSFAQMTTTQGSWFYNVKFLDFHRTSGSGSCVKLTEGYQCEVRKCVFTCETGASSDGGIETVSSSSCLYADNIFSGPWDVIIYDSGNALNNVIAYNYSTASNGSYFHNAHPSLNVIEGNCFSGHQSDGYHGSSSQNTMFRNWFRGPYPITLNRFKRKYVIAGNIIGTDGSQSGAISWGNPNIGNGDASGFAGPTGLSDQVGQLDYMQNGGTPFTYTIQAGDVSAGDFWQDWNITGTLTTKTSDTVGVFTVSNGNFFTGSSPTASAALLIYARWGSGSYAYNGSVTAVAGASVSITFAGGTALPATSTVVNLFMGPAGWQERDLDVQASSTQAGNYTASASGTGSVTNSIGADTFPDSLVYAAKPAFFRSLAWPPFNPNSYATASAERIPAGYRYINGNDPPAEGGSYDASLRSKTRAGRVRGLLR